MTEGNLGAENEKVTFQWAFGIDKSVRLAHFLDNPRRHVLGSANDTSLLGYRGVPARGIKLEVAQEKREKEFQ